MLNNKTLGQAGEERAVAYLKNNDYSILAQNYSVKVGEIDIVAMKKQDNTVVFVEVKTRRDESFGRPGGAVNYYKQQHIIRSAQWFLHHHHLDFSPCQFDVIEVLHPSEYIWKINHIENAFEL